MSETVKSPDIAFVICTGSPDYHIPHDLLELSCVSPRLFRKPVTNLNNLREELLRIIEILNNRKEVSS